MSARRSARCLSCLGPVEPETTRHPACTRALFGTESEPTIDIEMAKLHTYGLAMAGQTTLSGAQRKLSLSLTADRTTLRLAVAGTQYILKPQAAVFPALPENEHVTMLLAKAVGLAVPPFGLVRLSDGSLAYLVARFDRSDGTKIAMEDFCQLAENAPKEKYTGSAELLFRLVRQFASEPGVDALRLFRQLLFAWWTGNGDLHLKNVALLADASRFRMSPVFDLGCTRLVIANDALALPVGGRRDRLQRQHWMALGKYARLPRRAVQRVISEVVEGLDDACLTIETSPLTPPMQDAYVDLLRQRAGVLTTSE